MAESSLLKNIIANALIGTERQSFSPPVIQGKLGEVLAKLDFSQPEAALLSTVAVISLYQQAGSSPTKDETPLPSPCDLDEPLVRCSDRATYYLNLMLNGQSTEALLAEFLKALAAAGQRIPETLLPNLLDLGKRKSDLRAAIAQTIGKRGQWLASQNSEWSYIANSDDLSVWETGSKAARLSWLQKQRGQNPERAREYLESTWKKEVAGNRVAFLEIFQTDLTMIDEPFLESLLGDRSKEVRRKVTELLSHLPESRLCQRMAAIAQSLIQPKFASGKLYGFRVNLLETCDEALIRDGIEPKSLLKDMGDRAWWLYQILQATPLSIWTQLFNASPNDILQSAKNSEFVQALLGGWVKATTQQKNGEWAIAFLKPEIVAILESKSSYPVQFPTLELLELLSAQQRTLVVTDFLKVSTSYLDWLMFLKQNQLSQEMISILLNVINRHMHTSEIKYQDWQLEQHLHEFSLRIPVDAIANAIEIISQSQPKEIYTKLVENFSDTLQFRQNMLSAIAES